MITLVPEVIVDQGNIGGNKTSAHTAGFLAY